MFQMISESPWGLCVPESVLLCVSEARMCVCMHAFMLRTCVCMCMFMGVCVSAHVCVSISVCV